MTRMTPMMKMIALWGMVVVLGTFAGAAFAQPGAGSAPAAAPAGSAAAAPAADAPPAPEPASASATPQDAADARKACTQAMNADPKFAAEIVKTADERAAQERDRDTISAHTDAEAHVQKNERHVIYAYAAMWIIAALFVIFLWRRQQALQAEIAILRRDLEAAAGEATADKARS